MSEEKKAFEGSEDSEIQKSNKKLKLDSKKSKFSRKIEEKHNFEQMASDAHSQILNTQQQAYELGRRFLEILKDKTLPENKGPINSSVESEVLNNLIKFAIETNNDENEIEGMGSIAVITLLFKSAIISRNNYNKLEYRLEQLEKQLKANSKANEQ